MWSHHFSFPNLSIPKSPYAYWPVFIPSCPGDPECGLQPRSHRLLLLMGSCFPQLLFCLTCAARMPFSGQFNSQICRSMDTQGITFLFTYRYNIFLQSPNALSEWLDPQKFTASTTHLYLYFLQSHHLGWLPLSLCTWSS